MKPSAQRHALQKMPNAVKIVVGVLIGFVVWFVAATLANLVLRGAVHGYVEAEAVMNFTLPMLLARLGVGALGSLAAGLVCALSARSTPSAVKALAIALVLFFVPVHYSLWAQFPLWYHAAFLLSLSPLVWLGAKVLRSIGSEDAASAD